MNANRRQFLAATAGASLAATAGCLGLLSDATTFEAQQAATAEAVASDGNYVKQEPRELRAERTFSVGDQEQTVTVVNWVTEYYKTIDVGPLSGQRAGVFAAVSTPQVEILGESFNPLADASPRNIISRFQQQYGGMTVGDRVGQTTLGALGASALVSTFEGSATMAGQQVDTNFVVSGSVENAGDHVVSLGVFPRELDEQGTVHAMIENLEHPVSSE
ncbi:DUF6517 family protein [Haloarchaeobius iranensis]|uniref:Uncharacterized protein n=1 Tax=Haloarchaeobius iranensis TaxID=996166 RepID=A0A1G9YVJ5_9EURY|nr:DUF6517 family protein [Haloarchaeobius iranensis]SDN12937.1 hypothetical protein SAMN05192554_11648 [Haloarchaeobius iranensis]